MRLCGIETEYGLAVEERTPADQMLDAARLVSSLEGQACTAWDYAFESSRNDLRGFKVESLATDPVDARWDEGREAPVERVDRVLPNGARFYNDHGHPEYATPECRRLLDIVAHDRAGERIVLAAARAYERETGHRVRLYKNNTDFHGASYGTHENYLVSRDIPFDRLLRGLVPFLCVRQMLVGAGKVGSEVGDRAPFQLSQRAEFFQELASVDTLYRRPIFNTRDEPHADPARWMRLHVIVGDANRMEWCTAMKVGMTALVLDLIEADDVPGLGLRSPVRTIAEVSKRLDAKSRVELESGSWTTPLDVLESYLAACEVRFGGRDAETDWVLAEWRLAVTDLAEDPARLADRVDWVAKRQILEQVGGGDVAHLQSVDLEYANLDPEESLFDALLADGAVQHLVPEPRVLDAMSIPPTTTRACERGTLIRENLHEIRTIGWRRAVLKSDEVIEFAPESTGVG
ncbi:MAG: proteasome accessory factor PafA2 family protein [Armatimonadota bacterium]